ncbi:MAG: hypothetical protein OHK93_008550 [Ramalina farinacea]|uniref:Uncharacterized protein n=1 Tax=Ramalina farinacea TaxID=258253 RepID=A0AA43TYL6_9LECA|nr:hypothetical protein [Ramalina farinacea]
MNERGKDVSWKLQHQGANTIRRVSTPELAVPACPICLPSDGLVLNLAILVVQGLDEAIDYLRAAVVVAGEERLGPRVQETVEVIQRHVTKVCIGVVQFGEQG